MSRSISHLPERIQGKIEVAPSGCWLWTAGLFPGGYGQLHWQGRPARAHRVVWELLVGPIPKDLVLDHDHPEFGCSVRRCVNPGHLEVVTIRINNSRNGRSAAAGGYCQRGHDIAVVGLVASHCRECHRMTTRRLHSMYAEELRRNGFTKSGVGHCMNPDCTNSATFRLGDAHFCLKHARQLARSVPA